MTQKKKAARLKDIRNRRVTCRTFAGYIGLIDGRPDVDYWPNRAAGLRVVHVFLNERLARTVYADVRMVTVTGPWYSKAEKP
jgi:hypothetical protein